MSKIKDHLDKKYVPTLTKSFPWSNSTAVELKEELAVNIEKPQIINPRHGRRTGLKAIISMGDLTGWQMMRKLGQDTAKQLVYSTMTHAFRPASSLSCLSYSVYFARQCNT